MTAPARRFEPDALRQWLAQVFEARGLLHADAALAAAVLVRSEMRGYRTHGLVRVASYVQRLDAGEFNARATLVHRTFPGGITLDADGAMGQVAGTRAVQLGVEALAQSASVLIAVRDCGHLGALGMFGLLAAEAGVFAVVGQRNPPLLAMEGFAGPAIGHNPLAFGCPMPQGDPVVFDIACSVAARGHILIAAREGKPIPATWALDEDGVPTTDATRALHGALLPMGGHKGIGIAMMIECLAGALTTTTASLDSSRDVLPTGGAVARQGAFLWLVRPGAFLDEGMFGAGMAHWTQTYLRSGGGRSRLPGSRGAALERECLAQGIAIAGALHKELQGVGEQCGVPFPQT